MLLIQIYAPDDLCLLFKSTQQSTFVSRIFYIFFPRRDGVFKALEETAAVIFEVTWRYSLLMRDPQTLNVCWITEFDWNC